MSSTGAIRCDWVRRIFWVSDTGKWPSMPSDIVSLAVSTGLGVSVLAGIVSGVVYILAHGVQKKKSRKENNARYCEVCGTYLHSINGILGGERYITCTKCQKTVCKFRCSSLSDRTGWICNNCLRPPESWFQGILKVIQPNKTEDQDGKMNFDPLNEADEDIETIRKKKKEQIRDFIEKLVNVMLGENVDDASVSKIYNDKQYLPITGQSPSSAHAALKSIIERLLQETSDLSNLQKLPEHPAIPSDQSDRSYEDLLATAIINKVISSSQNHLPSSSAASVSSRISTSSRNHDKEYFFGEETLDSKWKTTDLETTSVSSIEDWLYSDSSFGSKKYVDKVTLTIKQDIEEVSHTDSENEEEEDDDNEYFRSKSSLVGDDEPNWFLQKRQFQGTHSPVPVPMLVPKPTTDAKVLIGDKELDETSDLSDAGSDYGELDVIPTRHGLLIESKTIIGGKNVVHAGSDGESSADSGVKEVDRDKSGYDDPIFKESHKDDYNDSAFISKADITVDDDNVEDASILSIYSNTEKEAEYTEKYASLPRTILKTPTPPSRPSLHKSDIADSTNLETSTGEPKNADNVDVEDDEDISIGEFTGRYSQREKEKWKHAVEMKNNPYSKENIERRIRKSRSALDSLFGPDYYARQASSPTGERAKSAEGRDMSWPPLKPLNDSDEETNNKIVIEPVPYGIPRIEDTYTESTQIETEEIKPTLRTRAPKAEGEPETAVSELTSDSDLSYVNYYDVTNSQVYKTKNGTDENQNEKNVNGTDEDRIEIVKREVPTPKERRYVKAQSIYSPHSLKPSSNNSTLRRHRSDSDLLEDSFDAPPKVLGRKKDNTLISRIYSQPHVRQFALSSRNQVPVEDAPSTPIYSSQRSLNEITFRYNGKVPVYHSDDGASLNRNSQRSSYHSSSENMLENGSLKEETVAQPKVYQPPPVERVYETRSQTMSISSEDDVFSEHSSTVGHPVVRSGSKTHLYSSSEDLLSVEEYERPHRKKDNTLIEKIYQNPNVRSFALSSRDYIPVQEARKTYSSEDELSEGKVPSPLPPLPKTPVKTRKSLEKNIPHEKTTMEATAVDVEEPETLIISPPAPFDEGDGSQHSEPHLEIHKTQPEDVKYERNMVSPDPEINEIAKRKIVHNLLEQFSGHHTDVESKPKVNGEMREINNNEEEKHVSVKELRKRFENSDGKNIVVSSLTARSLSKQMRENLRK